MSEPRRMHRMAVFRGLRRTTMLAAVPFALFAALPAGAQTVEETASLMVDEPQEAPPFWTKRVFGYVTTRDGTRLAYSALLPKGTGPFPVVINYSGYDPAAIGGPAYRHNNTAMSVTLDRELVERGYAVAGVNLRGSGCSSGLFDEADPNFGPDGRDAVEFLAVQPWADGNVGMVNYSWAGVSQVLTAAQRPPHLRAIAPGMVPADPRDTSAPGGVPSPGTRAPWWSFVMSRWEAVRRDALERRDQDCLARLQINSENANRVTPESIALRHPLRDDYTDRRAVRRFAANIEVPVLSMTAFQDQIVTSHDGHSFQKMLDPHQVWVVQTNGWHAMYDASPFRQKLLRFLDRFVKGDPNGFDREPHVEIWYESSTHGAGTAAFENASPRVVVKQADFPPVLRTRHFALSTNDALISDRAGTGAPDKYQYPVPSATVNTGLVGNNWGPTPADFRKGAAVYTSAPLSETLVTYGPASADLWVSTTALDSDLQLTLTEVRPDGQELFIQRGWLRLSNRALDDGLSTELAPAPVDRPDTLRVMPLGKPVLARVELFNFAHILRAGSRLRLWIDTPSASGFLVFAPGSTASINQIWHDAEHPSQLSLGVLQGVAPPPVLPQCATVLMQPCRPDPLAHSQ